MSYLSILPDKVSNTYEGKTLSLWAMYIYLIVMTFRSLVHTFADDAGLNSIASVIVFPFIDGLDPNRIIYLFGSLWGGAQIVCLAFSIIIVLKYKNLLPLVWLLFIFDNILKLSVLQLRYPGPEYTTSTAPGGITGTFIMLLFTLIMFYLSILRKKDIHGS